MDIDRQKDSQTDRESPSPLEGAYRGFQSGGQNDMKNIGARQDQKCPAKCDFFLQGKMVTILCEKRWGANATSPPPLPHIP